MLLHQGSATGGITRASLPVPGPLLFVEHCDVAGNTVTLRHVHPLSTPFQIPAQNMRQAKRKRTKVPDCDIAQRLLVQALLSRKPKTKALVKARGMKGKG